MLGPVAVPWPAGARFPQVIGLDPHAPHVQSQVHVRKTKPKMEQLEDLTQNAQGTTRGPYTAMTSKMM